MLATFSFFQNFKSQLKEKKIMTSRKFKRMVPCNYLLSPKIFAGMLPSVEMALEKVCDVKRGLLRGRVNAHLNF